MKDEKEPTVLDYFLAKIQFWNDKSRVYDEYLQNLPVENSRLSESLLPDTSFADETSTGELEQQPGGEADTAIGVEVPVPEQALTSKRFPWRITLGLLSALTAQGLMESNRQNGFLAVLFYVVAVGLFLWSIRIKEFSIPAIEEGQKRILDLRYREIPLLLSVPMLIGAFLSFGSQQFTTLNLLLWGACVLLLIGALWLPVDKENQKFKLQQVWEAFRQPFLTVRVNWWVFAVAGAVIISVFFRTTQLDQIPGEMFSDQAEKLLDVQDVLDGQTPLFFVRNTGREAFQMYLTAAVVKVFGTGISFLSLKIGTVLCGLLMLPYMYLLGKELGGSQWAGLFALILIGVAYWPNVIARVGLRYILYACFTAPTLYYFIRGLRRTNRNDFILSGIFLGIGLHGYSSFRFVPIILVIGAILFWLHHLRAPEQKKTVLIGLIFVALISFVVFLPLFRYLISNPDMFSYRMQTRLGTLETDYPGNPFWIFWENFVKANLMFFTNNGNVWVHSIPERPALDVVTAVTYFLGILVLLVRYFKKRNWLDLFWLVSIPLLLMPSILSLAFPDENPCLNRTSGAMVPVFVAAGVGLETLLRNIKSVIGGKQGKIIGIVVGGLLLIWSAGANYDLVFRQYRQQFLLGAWNSSDMGKVIRGYADSIGTPDTAFVVPYPYWVDTRLVGINAGYPRKDYAIAQENLVDTLSTPAPKLFIFKPDDIDTLQNLKSLYPEGSLKLYEAFHDSKNFYIYLTASQ